MGGRGEGGGGGEGGDVMRGEEWSGEGEGGRERIQGGRDRGGGRCMEEERGEREGTAEESVKHKDGFLRLAREELLCCMTTGQRCLLKG